MQKSFLCTASQGTALLFFLLGVQGCIAWLTPEQYAQDYVNGVDRLYQPLTTEMCGTEPYRSKLKSCKLFLKNKSKMRKISEKYLVQPFNHWKGNGVKELKNNIIVRASMSRFSSAVDHYRTGRVSGGHARPYSYLSLRSKRSRTWTNVNDDAVILHRQKRVVTLNKKGKNPCAEDTSRRATLFHALDAQTGVVLELFQNPEQHMYQTFFTKECLPYKHPGFACELQYVEFLTAVFHPLSSNPEDVILRPVKIPSGCAMVLL